MRGDIVDNITQGVRRKSIAMMKSKSALSMDDIARAHLRSRQIGGALCATAATREPRSFAVLRI